MVFRRAAFPALLLLAAFLRLYHLGLHSLWLDELFSVRSALRESLPGLIDELAADVHPPLYFLLLRGWLSASPAMNPDTWVRLPGALAGVLGVGLTVRLGERLGGNGLLAGLFYAVAPFAVGLEREARSNGLFTALALGSGLCLLRGLETPARRWFGLYALLSAAVLYTHPFGIFVLIAQGFFLLARSPRPLLRPWLGAWLVAGVAFLPWLKILLGQARHFSSDTWYQMPTGDALAWLGESLAGGVGPAILLLLGVVLAIPRGERSLGWLTAHLVGLLLLPWAISYGWAPILRDRNVLPLLPVFCVVAAQGWSTVRAPGKEWVVAGVSLLATVRAVFLEPEPEQWRDAAAVVRQEWKEGDRIIANHTWLWRWYLPEPFALQGEIPEDGRLWVLTGHNEEGLPELPRGELLLDRTLRGARVRLLDLSLHRLELGKEQGPPTWVDGVLHLYWAQAFQAENLLMQGNCAVGVQGWGDPAAGEKAKLEIGLIGESWQHWEPLELPLEDGWVWTQAVEVRGPARLSLEFVNDAKVGEEDRNAHLRGIYWRCRP